jgi:hypothetical protein
MCGLAKKTKWFWKKIMAAKIHKTRKEIEMKNREILFALFRD